MLKLSRLGHVAMRVTDVERSKKFYGEVLGFEVIEEDPEHGGVFMALPGLSHTIDLFQAPDEAPAATPGAVGVRHLAFLVESEADFKDAWRTLREHGVPIDRAMDHVSQKSIYFRDPDGTVLEIYHELPNARELFRQGRGDRDETLVFEP
jgi:catechol 2,3-dioxygenase